MPSRIRPKIYTKTGDGGTTALVSGRRVSKTDLRIEAYGSVDELNSCVGLALAFLKDFLGKNQDDDLLPKALGGFQHLIGSLSKIQHELFNLGSQLSCDDLEMSLKLPDISETMILFLEKEIDEMSRDLPELKDFILPGAGLSGAQLHVCRTLARRTERLALALKNSLIAKDSGVEPNSKGSAKNDRQDLDKEPGPKKLAKTEEQTTEPVLEISLRYLNRLSDYFFTAARFSNHLEGYEEIIWVKE